MMPRRRDIFGRSLLLGLLGGVVMGFVGLAVLVVFLMLEQL